MNEGDLCRALVKQLRTSLPDAVIFKHADHVTAGVPDISVTRGQKTLWIEVKFARPNVNSRGIQAYTCRRLSEHGNCWFVIYIEQPRGVVIIDARDVENWCKTPPQLGYNHQYVVDRVRSATEEDFN